MLRNFHCIFSGSYLDTFSHCLRTAFLIEHLQWLLLGKPFLTYFWQIFSFYNTWNTTKPFYKMETLTKNVLNKYYCIIQMLEVASCLNLRKNQIKLFTFGEQWIIDYDKTISRWNPTLFIYEEYEKYPVSSCWLIIFKLKL